MFKIRKIVKLYLAYYFAVIIILQASAEKKSTIPESTSF